jgi:hypothetical protein
MKLAAILGIYLLSLGCLTQPPASVTSSNSSTRQGQDTAPVTQPQSSQAQSTEPTQPVPSPNNQTPNSSGQVKPSPKRPRHHKKTTPCSTSPTALNPAVGGPADATNPAGAWSADAGSTNAGSTNAGSTNASSAASGSANADSAKDGSAALKPCPPPKKVVRNGGSEEPKVQLRGGTDAEHASHQRSTEELRVATEENLKKMAGRQLNPSQQEMVSQIKQFMEQSKTAAAAGDLQRGHNLAMKARLLSEELVKP